jgi:hypothetical protein
MGQEMSDEEIPELDALLEKVKREHPNSVAALASSGNGSAPEFVPEIKVAAKLSPIEYDHQREAIADKLGIRVSTLDKIIKKQAQAEENTIRFPILALAVYSSAAHDWLLEPDGYSPDCYSIDHIQAKAKAATDMVERGVRLRDIAAVMQIPMALRRVSQAPRIWRAHATTRNGSCHACRARCRACGLGCALCTAHISEAAPSLPIGQPNMPCKSRLEAKTNCFRFCTIYRTGFEPAGVTMVINLLCVRLSRPCHCGPSRN